MEIDWMILADAAEIVNGKLYLLGGGWDTLGAPGGQFPVQRLCTVAAAYVVPWHETNQRHPVEIEFADGDGGVLATISGTIEVGRPPGLPPGSDQRAQLATQVALSFPQAGTYVVVARVNGEEARRLSFRVVST